MIAALVLMLTQTPFAKIVVHCDQPTVTVSKDLYGVFFEEINCAGDGGLYAEMVRNRSFEDSDKPEHWELAKGSSGTIELGKDGVRNLLRIKATSGAAVVNRGYWGMSARKDTEYALSIRGRSRGATAIVARLESENGQVLAQATLACGADWSDMKATLKPSKNDAKARLRVGLESSGEVDLDFVSLFPRDEWGKMSTIRHDLRQKLSELRPGFMRFPGGCWVEGDTMATAQRWKQTIGPIENRRTQPNLWGYQSTNGLGYHEYLQLCADLGAAPMFVINCGMSHKENVPLDKMDEFVQDALDAIEYANGPVTSKWGAERAKNGHPGSFNLKYLEIGNENGGPAYEERYALIYNAVKAKYPEILTIACLWGGMPKNTPIEIIDEHYYSNPDFFFQNANRYDKYDRKGPKVYVGEYAVTQGCGQGNLIAAIGEAAFMTGMERNSDHVVMASYAPLFANVNHKGWNPDLICFDSAKSYGTPSYYVQKLFSENRPTRILKAELTNVRAKKEKFPAGGIGVGTWNTQAEFKDFKVTQGAKTLFDSPDGKGLTVESGDWSNKDGVLAQTGKGDGTRASIGDATWKNYTLTLKAKKTGGVEGFLITVGRKDKDNYLWFNLGGWGNQQYGLEYSVNGGKRLIGGHSPNKIETGRWYDIKIEYAEERIRASVDGKLVYDEQTPATQPLHMTAGKNEKGAIVLKVVNGSGDPIETDVFLENGPGIIYTQIETLTSKSRLDENSLAQPLKIAPKKSSMKVVEGNRFNYRFPPYSLTILKCSGPRW